MRDRDLMKSAVATRTAVFVVVGVVMLTSATANVFAGENRNGAGSPVASDSVDSSFYGPLPCLVDERVKLARDSRVGVGRVIGGGYYCNAFILSNGAFVTDGGCVDPGADGTVGLGFLDSVVQFNVPDSTDEGCVQTDSDTRIYPITGVVDFQHARVGSISVPAKNWAVFTVGPDANGNEAAANEGFLRPDNGGPLPFLNLRVAGYGRDNLDPVGGGLCIGNSDSFTLQTALGSLEYFDAPEIGHSAFTVPTSVGSPIIQDVTGRAIGIHNQTTCEVGSINSGVAFTKRKLADAINSFQGANAVHLDAEASAGGDGSVFDPFDELAEAVDATPEGGRLVIVTGSYAGAATIDKQIDIITPVGGVTLGD